MSLFCISVLFLHWRMKRSNTALAFIETNWLRPSRLEPI
jgi:hypothetical protein